MMQIDISDIDNVIELITTHKLSRCWHLLTHQWDEINYGEDKSWIKKGADDVRKP